MAIVEHPEPEYNNLTEHYSETLETPELAESPKTVASIIIGAWDGDNPVEAANATLNSYHLRTDCHDIKARLIDGINTVLVDDDETETTDSDGCEDDMCPSLL